MDSIEHLIECIKKINDSWIFNTTSQIELDDIVEKGFEALTNDKTQAKILVELSGEK